MDDKTRPYKVCVVREYTQRNATDILPWSARNPGVKSLEYLWIISGLRIWTSLLTRLKYLQNLHRDYKNNATLFPKFKSED